jgi:FkbM family methyltransferase
MFRELARRGIVPERLVWDMPLDPVFDVRVEGGQSFRYTGSKADVVARHLFWGELTRWESETWREFVPLARQARGFVDVGAFTGTYTLVACAVNPALRCVAYEPVPRVFDRLEANVALNGWGDRVQTVNAAVSTEVGTARFFLPGREFPDTGHLEISERAPREGDGGWVDVPTATLRATVPAELSIDLMKIDVEDAEGPVLRGMGDVVSDQRPTIVIELLCGGSHAEAIAVLDDVGYHYFHLTDRGRVPVANPVPAEGDPFMNYLCIPKQ